MSPSEQGMSAGKPLRGRTIVITRARAQAAPFVKAVEALGGEVVEFPTIEILPPESYDPLDKAIQEMARYDWIVFTSANGVSHFFDRLHHLKRGIGELKGKKIAAIGPETARALRSNGLRVDLLPQEYRAEAILDGLKPEEVKGKRVLLPRAARARDVLPDTLRKWGAEVDVVQAYRTAAARSDAGSLKSLLERKKIDVIAFTSSSTVAHFAALFPGEDLKRLLGHTAIACIGPITEQTAAEMGIKADVVAKDYTIAGLVGAIVDFIRAGGD